MASTWRWRAADPSRSTIARGTRSSRSQAARVSSDPHGLIATYGREQAHRDLGLAARRAHRNAPGRRRAGGLRPQRRADRHGGSGDLGCGEREAQPSAAVFAADVTLAFSPDGTRLAVGSGDEVRVFDARSGAELQVLRHRGAAEYKVVFSPDGSMLASWADDGTRVWALDIDDLLEIARQNVTRSLSDEECRRYLHVAACPRG